MSLVWLVGVRRGRREKSLPRACQNLRPDIVDGAQGRRGGIWA